MSAESDNYVPPTDLVRSDYGWAKRPGGWENATPAVRMEHFDRWLAKHDREVIAARFRYEAKVYRAADTPTTDGIADTLSRLADLVERGTS